MNPDSEISYSTGSPGYQYKAISFSSEASGQWFYPGPTGPFTTALNRAERVGGYSAVAWIRAKDMRE